MKEKNNKHVDSDDIRIVEETVENLDYFYGNDGDKKSVGPSKVKQIIIFSGVFVILFVIFSIIMGYVEMNHYGVVGKNKYITKKYVEQYETWEETNNKIEEIYKYWFVYPETNVETALSMQNVDLEKDTPTTGDYGNETNGRIYTYYFDNKTYHDSMSEKLLNYAQYKKYQVGSFINFDSEDESDTALVAALNIYYLSVVDPQSQTTISDISYYTIVKNVLYWNYVCANKETIKTYQDTYKYNIDHGDDSQKAYPSNVMTMYYWIQLWSSTKDLVKDAI